MIKTVLATIGLFVVVQKSYEFYCDYQELKKENEFFHRQEKTGEHERY
ncbi:hypothetical protein [Castellaniella caeni]|nr:hypothetical protein [Castellaniella caeni]